MPVAKLMENCRPGTGDSAEAEAAQLLLVSKAGGMPSERECPGGENSVLFPRELRSAGWLADGKVKWSELLMYSVCS